MRATVAQVETHQSLPAPQFLLTFGPPAIETILDDLDLESFSFQFIAVLLKRGVHLVKHVNVPSAQINI